MKINILSELTICEYPIFDIYHPIFVASSFELKPEYWNKDIITQALVTYIVREGFAGSLPCGR